jgi:O-acetyl-ADP-ribose deacetylase
MPANDSQLPDLDPSKQAPDPRLSVICADITQLDVDAIVNAANAELAGGGGVDGAIHAAAGPGLMIACRQIGGCATGAAVLTPGFKLAARHVIHAVGPIWAGGGQNEAALLASCYQQCMSIAREHQFQSLAFSAISCGVYGFPIEQAAQIAVQTVGAELATTPTLQRVDFICFGDVVESAYRQALNR